jgi:uncharacterized protein (DUF1697 family)
MTTYIALLRAVNVGGTGKLPMKDLSALCARLGFENVRTYIQSGHVVFQSALSEEKVRTRLEQALTAKLGKPADAMLRTAEELHAILQANPFHDEPPNKVAVMFLSGALPKSALSEVVAPGGEQFRPCKREIYVYFPNGMGQSKFKLPRSIGPATARNVNTVAKLVAMATETPHAK